MLFSKFDTKTYQDISNKSSIQKPSWKYDKNINTKNIFFEYIKNRLETTTNRFN